MIRRVAAIFLAVLTVAGCVSADMYAANYYAVGGEDAASITSGAMGAIIVDLKTGGDCSTVDLRYVNLDTGEVSTRNIEQTYTAFQMSSINAGGVPTIILLAPGRYAFQGGQCRWAAGGLYVGGVTDYELSLDDMALWLRPFVVHGGEIVYTGTAVHEELVQEWGKGLTSAERLTGEIARSADRFRLFEVRDNEPTVREALQRYNPSLADRLVNRTAPALLDKTAVRQIIIDAYATVTSAAAPDNAAVTAARMRAAEALSRYLSERREQTAAEDIRQTTAPRNTSP